VPSGMVGKIVVGERSPWDDVFSHAPIVAQGAENARAVASRMVSALVARALCASSLGVVTMVGCAPRRQETTVHPMPSQAASAIAWESHDGGPDCRDARVGAPFETPAGDASASSTGASKQAEDCLASPSCPAADAARLLVAASDVHDAGLDCFRFVDGAGTTRDLPRARSCFERRAKSLACDGSSMSLDAAQLAFMRIDGVGGKPDASGARALLDGCYDDVTRAAVLEHAAAKERDPRTPPVDFCKEIGGTTITANECAARDAKNTDTTRQLEAKAVVASLDDAGKELFATSERTYGDYVTAMGAFAYEIYIQGTIRSGMALSVEAALKARRVTDLAEFSTFVAKGTSTKDVEAAQHASAAALARVGTATPAEKAALQKTQQAWEAYRDAEVALYSHAFGPKQGTDRVHAAVLVRLELRRAKECEPPSASGE
jgi:hypothetical protein